MRVSHVPDLSARDLQAVLAVAEYRSFIAAAAFLQTSQPALTRAIKRVEDVLGVRLFDRTTRRVEITNAGRAAGSGCRPECHNFQALDPWHPRVSYVARCPPAPPSLRRARP